MTFEDVKTMELSGQINEELLICHICYGRYSVRDRLPKLLHCSHTFCVECISQYLRKRQKKSKHKFPCPLCRRETNVGKEGVSGLTNNLTVMSLLDILDRRAIEQFSRESVRRRHSTLSAGGTSLTRQGSKRRPALHSIAWDKIPEASATTVSAIGAIVEEGSDGNNESKIHCDSCNKVTTTQRKSECKHVLCDECALKDKKSCVKCKQNNSASTSRHSTMMGSRITSSSPADRPPPVNPAYGEVTEYTQILPIKPPVPTRTSPVKPMGSLSPAQATAYQNALSAGASTSSSSLSSSSKPSKPSVIISPPQVLPSFSSESSTQSRAGTLGRSSSSHTMHITSTQSSGLSTFGHSLHSQIALPSSDSAQSLPELNSPILLSSPPQPPPRRISNEGSALASPLRLVCKFGQFSTVRLQTNAFHQPTQLACSEFTNDWAVVDAVNMSVQIFSSKGQYKSLFKVLGVSSVCFVSPERLAISTHRGLVIHHITGALVRELSIGRCECITAYKHGGFIVGQAAKVLIYGAGVTVGAGDINKQCREIKQRKTGKFKRATPFQQIVSVAVTSNKDIVILDAKLGDISILDDRGKVLLIIDPATEPCRQLKQPHAVTLDGSGNVMVSDTGNRRVLRFSANGMFSRCLLNLDLGPSASSPSPISGLQLGGTSVYGVAVNLRGYLGVVIAGSETAEVRIYQL